MALPGRTTPAVGDINDKYRYSHNGQEKDNEIFIGALSAEYWEYDSRTGRRWERDPVVKPWESSYACFRNNPIFYSDPSGLDGEGPNGECPEDGAGHQTRLPKENPFKKPREESSGETDNNNSKGRFYTGIPGPKWGREIRTNWIFNNTQSSSFLTRDRYSYDYRLYPYQGEMGGPFGSYWKLGSHNTVGVNGETITSPGAFPSRTLDEGAKQTVINWQMNIDKKTKLSFGGGIHHLKLGFEPNSSLGIRDDLGSTIVGGYFGYSKTGDGPIGKNLSININILAGPLLSNPTAVDIAKNVDITSYKALYGNPITLVGGGLSLGVAPTLEIGGPWSIFVQGSINATSYKASFFGNTYKNNTLGFGIGTGVFLKFLVSPDEIHIYNFIIRKSIFK